MTSEIPSETCLDGQGVGGVAEEQQPSDGPITGVETAREIKIDPEFRALIPPLTEEELRLLEESLLRDGCRDPLVVWKGHDILVDGHHRYELCRCHGIPFDVVELELANRCVAELWVLKNQLGRRNLNTYQRAALALRAEQVMSEQAKENQREGGRKKVPQKSAEAPEARETRERLAEGAGVSHDTIAKVRAIREKGSEATLQKLSRGEMTINAAYKALRGAKVKRKARKRGDAAGGVLEVETEPTGGEPHGYEAIRRAAAAIRKGIEEVRAMRFEPVPEWVPEELLRLQGELVQLLEESRERVPQEQGAGLKIAQRDV